MILVHVKTEPPTWITTALHAESSRPAPISVTISAENVENVVSPPQNPVMTSSRHSGASAP